MSRAIEKVTIGGGQDGRFVLGAAQAAATLNVGSTFNRIRIGMRLEFDDSGGNVTSPMLAIGVMSNPSALVANGPLSGTGTGHFIGVLNENTSLLTRNAGSPSYYSGALLLQKKVGATLTTVTGVSGAKFPVGVSQRRCVFMEFDRVNAKAGMAYATGIGGPDHSYAQLVQGMETEILTTAALTSIFGATDNFLGSSPSGIAQSSVAFNEGTNGPLNAIVIGWNKTIPLLHYSEVLFTLWS